MYPKKFSEQEVLQIVEKKNNKKSTDSNGLSMNIIIRSY